MTTTREWQAIGYSVNRTMHATAHTTSVREALDRDGFAVIPGLVSMSLVQAAIAAIERRSFTVNPSVRRRCGSTYAIRNLYEVAPELRSLSVQEGIAALIRGVLGGDGFVMRAILFDKNPAGNWALPWHQDTTIAVQERIEAPGFGPWSVKAGVVHVQPPGEILTRVLTARIHLDDCTAADGALQVLPGSHLQGILESEQIQHWRHTSPVVCECSAGDVLFMRPLVLHASSSASKPRHRRVVHLEFAASALPFGLHWHRE